MDAHPHVAAPTVLRYAAFAAPGVGGGVESAAGGNPAGIVLDATDLDDATMLRIAAEVGYAETAFVVETGVHGDANHLRVRYFSPIAEVPFCGHATVATAVALAERSGPGRFTFDTAVGEVVINTTQSQSGSGTSEMTAAFTSVEPAVRHLDTATLRALLALLGLTAADLDDRFPVRVAYAGNWHPVVVLRDRAVFDSFTFDPQQMRELMDAEGWAGTVTIARAVTPLSAELPSPSSSITLSGSAAEFETRNLFPVGAITEDPATGSAAASLGGYLRALNLVDAPARVIVHQGRHVGRPSLLTVDIPEAGGIVVSGTAVPIA